MMDSPYLIDLPAALDPLQAGGKAAGLARALAGGLLAPPGFVLARQALRDFLAQNGLAESAAALFAGYTQQDWRGREAAYAVFYRRAQAAPLPAGLRTAVEPAVRALLANAPAGLAVRSSGICEDGERASFAGVFRSSLGARRLDAFWRAVRACWRSAWSPRAWAYAQKMGLALTPDGMAVLVQPLIPAEASGIAFTADPVTGDPWKIVVNSVRGLSPDLADGAAPADRWVLAWDTSEIQEQRVADKPSALRAVAGAIRTEPLPPEQRQAPALDPDQARRVGALALAADRLFDRRVDVEWALAGGELWLLQARPLTALPSFFPHALSPEEAAETWTPYLNTFGNLNPRERLVAPFARDFWYSALWHAFLEPGDVFPRGQFRERDFHGYRYATPRKWSGGQPDPARTEAWLNQHEPRLRRGWLEQLERARQANRRADQALAAAQGPVERLRALLDHAREERHMQAYVWYAPQWLIFTCEFLLKAFLEQAGLGLPAEETAAGLLQGLSCYSVERAAAAQALGRAVQEAAVEQAFANLPLSRVVPHLQETQPGCRFLTDLRDFCRDWGVEPPDFVRAVAGGQDVDGVLLVIKNSLLDPHSPRVAAALSAAVARRARVEDEVRAALREKAPDQLARFVRLLDWAQFWTPALDNRKWHCTMTVSLRRGELKRHAAESLLEAGLIDHPDHLALLTVDEWQSFVDTPDPDALRGLYERRRLEYERDRRLEPLPYLGQPPEAPPDGPDGGPAAPSVEPAPEAAGGSATLRGEGLAPGRVRGRARVVANMDAENYADRLTSEDILVCGPESFSAEWRRDYYALFLVVRGMVAVQGAQLHHATQIARECGVPFVNLPAATLAHIPDGAEIELDGGNGMVLL